MDVSSNCPLETWNWDLSLARFFCLLQGAATAAAKLFVNRGKKYMDFTYGTKEGGFLSRVLQMDTGLESCTCSKRVLGIFFFLISPDCSPCARNREIGNILRCALLLPFTPNTWMCVKKTQTFLGVFPRDFWPQIYI